MTVEEKTAHDALINTLKSEISAALSQVKKETAEEIQTMIAELEAQIAELQAKLETAEPKAEEAEKMKKEMIDIQTKLKAMNENGNVSKPVNEIEKNLDAIKGIAKKTSKNSVVIKALTSRASITGNQQAIELPEIGQMAHRSLTAYDIFPKVPVGDGNHNGVIRYYDWDAATSVRAAASIAEGAAFPESTAKFATYTISLKKIGDTLPVTEELFEDAPMFAAELSLFLQTNVDIKVDDQIVNGDGTGSEVKGIVASVDAYTPVASGITAASIYDLIVKLKESITTTGGAKYNVNFAMMNIADINKMKLRKDVNNNYVIPPFADREGNQIDGVVVIENNAIVANTMVIGDNRFGRIYEMGGVEISEGTVGTQFTEDELTLKARKRLAFLIRNADKGGFKKVTSISAALTTLAS
jgi:HK97 family phage major capsid protein